MICHTVSADFALPGESLPCNEFLRHRSRSLELGMMFTLFYNRIFETTSKSIFDVEIKNSNYDHFTRCFLCYTNIISHEQIKIMNFRRLIFYI